MEIKLKESASREKRIPGTKNKRERAKKIFCFCYVFIAICMFLLPLTSMLMGAGNDDLFENRQLSSFPRLGAEGVSLRNFPSLFDTYFSEHFGLRSRMITLYSALVYYLTGDSASDRVIAGKDGWLFFHETLDDYTGGKVLGRQEVLLLYRNLYLQREYLSERGIGFVFLPVPNKNTVYGEYMPDRFQKRREKSSLELVYGHLKDKDVPFVDLREVLETGKSEAQLYHKKDTHWNNYGAMLAYREIMKKAGELVGSFDYDDYSRTDYSIERSWPGDLERMLLPAFDKKDYQVVFHKEQDFRFIRPVRSYDDMLIQTQTDTGDKRILMYRDSFANTLIPFVSGAFGYACYSRAVPYDYSLVDRIEPDMVVIEIAERNLPNLLETAPLMPAPRREIAAGQVREARKAGQSAGDTGEAGEGGGTGAAGPAYVTVFIEPEGRLQQAGIDKGRYVLISGDIVPEKSHENITEIILAFEGGNDSYLYEAFPVLREGSINGSCKLGYSMLLDADGIPEGEYGISVILRLSGDYANGEYPDREYVKVNTRYTVNFNGNQPSLR